VPVQFSTVRKMNKASKLVIEGEQATRLQALARRWGVLPAEALRRVLDQAFVGRGALVTLEAGFILLENLTFKKLSEGEKKT